MTSRKTNTVSHKGDTIFFSCAIFLILLFTTLLYLDFTKDYSAVKTKEIGYIEFKKKTAERKYTAQVLWGKVENTSPIYNFDTIRTSEDSLAIVHLDDGSKVELGSNTLVLFSLEDKTLSLDMQTGGIAVNTEGTETTTGTKPVLVIKSAGATFEASGKGDFSLSTNKDGAIEVDAYSGELQMSNGSETLSVKKGFRLFRDKDGKAETKEVSFTTTMPPNASIFMRKVVPAPISFTWEGKDSASEKTNLILSNFRNFSGKVITIPVKGNSINAEIPPGTYFWKIETEFNSSAPAKFTILKDISTSPVFPKEEEAFHFLKTPPMIRFKWVKSNYASSYTVEVFRDAELTDLVEELSSYSSAISSESFTPGRYYWRVRSLYAARIDADNFLGEVRTFNVEKQTELVAPVIPQDSKKTVISLVSIKDNGGILRWEAITSANSYKIEISKDLDFSNILISKSVRNNFFALPENMDTGDYFWRVSVNIDDETSEASDTGLFSVVEKGEIKTLFPLKNTYISPSSPSLFLTWTDENHGQRYKLEIAKNKNFFNPVVSEIVLTREITTKILTPSAYFWRTTLVDENDKLLQRSNTSTFTIFKIDKKMKLNKPLPKEKLDIVQLDDISFKWTDSALAEVYSFSVYNKLLNSKNIVYETLVTTSEITLSDLTLFRELDYQWEVTGLRKQDEEWIPVTDSKIGQFSIFLSKRVFVPMELNFGSNGAVSENLMGDKPILFIIPPEED